MQININMMKKWYETQFIAILAYIAAAALNHFGYYKLAVICIIAGSAKLILGMYQESKRGEKDEEERKQVMVEEF